jgi:hypothetical protein
MPAKRLMALVLLAALPAMGAEPPRNGALDYYRASLLVSKATSGERAADKLDWDKIGSNLDPAKMPPEFEEAKKELSADAVEQFIRGSRAPACDFQPHTEDGWKMLLPELAMMRTLTRQVRVDARAKMMEGDAGGAADRIAAMYRASAHATTGDTLISTLVGAAIARTADVEARVLAESGKLGEADRAKVLEALRPLKKDGLRFHAALEGERRITTGWLKMEYAGPGAPARFVRDFVDLSKEQGREETRRRAAAITKLSPQEFAEAATKMDGYYAEMLKDWDGPNPKDTLASLEKRLTDGEFGPIAAVLAPAMSNVRRSYEKCAESLNSAEEALTKKP